MLAELVFVTRLLGLMSGERPIQARVDPSVHAVEILLDGRRTHLLRGAPWRTKIDLGPELAPHELVAIARDEEGRELARDTQFINVPRPQAEIGVMFQRNRADITWQHIGRVMPKKMTVKLNNKLLARTLTRSVKLPPLAPEALNLLSVNLEFEDGSTAHREVVFGGFSEEVPAELTATIVRQRETGRTDHANCFRVEGKSITASEVETGNAAVLIVRGGSEPAEQFRRRDLNRAHIDETAFTMPRTAVRFVWPVANGAGNSDLFMTSDHISAILGMRFLLTNVSGPKGMSFRMTDAAAVAGTEALREQRRRAVVLVLGEEKDESRYRPDAVRRYFERIGVPLYVWSITGPRKDDSWGAVEDASTSDKLKGAVARLQRELDNQRIAWLPVDPYDALRVEASPECAWEPLARR